MSYFESNKKCEFTYSIPQLETPLKIDIEAKAMLEPFLSFILDHALRDIGSGFRLIQQIIKICPDCNPKSAVIVVDEREAAEIRTSIHRQAIKDSPKTQLHPIIAVPICISIEE